MKLFVVLALALATVAALPIDDEIYQEEIFADVIDEPEGRITNGQTASAGQFPYQVGLSLRIGNDATWCGGSLIGKNWVLTAAHCTESASSVTVYLGAVVRTQPTASYTVQRSAIIIHSGWNWNLLKNDISLIKIPTVATNSRVNTVALATDENSYANQEVIISGWGKTSDSGSVASNLQYATRTTISNDQCRQTFGRTITDTHICISTSGGVSTCNGDSGGPMVLSSNKRLIGVTSFGAGASCTEGYPVVFTRVTSYLSWIKSHTGI